MYIHKHGNLLGRFDANTWLLALTSEDIWKLGHRNYRRQTEMYFMPSWQMHLLNFHFSRQCLQQGPSSLRLHYHITLEVVMRWVKLNWEQCVPLCKLLHQLSFRWSRGLCIPLAPPGRSRLWSKHLSDFSAQFIDTFWATTCCSVRHSQIRDQIKHYQNLLIITW